MKKLNSEGTFTVTIRNPFWAKMPDKGVDTNRVQACLPGVVTIDGEEHGITAYLMFTNTYISGGKNAGKTLAKSNNDLLVTLGMKADANGYIDPLKLDDLNGKEVVFVTAFEADQNDNPVLRVKWVNPVKEALEANEVKGIFANLFSANNRQPLPPPPVAGGKTSPTDAVEDIDSIPF